MQLRILKCIRSLLSIALLEMEKFERLHLKTCRTCKKQIKKKPDVSHLTVIEGGKSEEN
jgi:hypothetical protein